LKVLVTGGAGYIGSICTAELLAAGHEPVVFDSLYQGHREAVPDGVPLVVGDLCDADAVKKLFNEHRGIDAIMHFASYTLVGESMQFPLKYLRDNTVAGANLLEQAVAHGVGRFILSSTANLFDDPAKMPIEPDERIVPGSPYGEGKFILERMLHWFERIYGMKYACLRYFNASGDTPNRGEDHTPELHIIPIVLEVAMGKREKLTIFGNDYPTKDGTCVRDYVHVLDLAQAHILAMQALDQLGSRKYNLGNGNGFTILELIETAEKITGREIAYEFGPRRAGDPAILIASSEKIKAELGWAPKYTTLEQILGSAWEWHSKHPNGYRS
jgi:UDP-glucose 4-epimerase